ncbi:unnamed protein product, partial [Tetraodon nigroviridis]
TSSEMRATLKRMAAPSLFGADVQTLLFHAEMQTKNRLRFKIYDGQKTRFEVPHEHVKTVRNNPSSPLNTVLEVKGQPFGLTVRRRESKKTLFDTTFAPLVFDDQYLQFSAKLPSHNIYGLGEHVHRQYRHNTDWRTWPIFTRDGFPNGGTHNLYGHYPFFLCLEDESGKSFGVFLMNSNAMEVTLQPAPAVTYMTIGGILDFYIFFGDTPEQVVQEFLELIGRPVIPPYWSLGFQLSRWNYGSLAEVKKTVERNRAVEIPYEIQYTDIDYMEDKKDFTYDKVKFAGLPEFADYLHAKGQKYILILDPAIATSKRVGNASYGSYDRGTAKNAWVFESDGKTPLLGELNQLCQSRAMAIGYNVQSVAMVMGCSMPSVVMVMGCSVTCHHSDGLQCASVVMGCSLAVVRLICGCWAEPVSLVSLTQRPLMADLSHWQVWPGQTVFPDYTSESCIEWWVDEYKRFSEEIKHDALWIDMNEVSNFKKGSVTGCETNKLNYPPYTPKILDEVMYSKTLCMDAQQAWGNHYDVHSLYGYSMVLASERALQSVFGGNRSLLLTRSSFPGVGKYSGHWLGDNAANWNDIKWAIPGMLEFGLFGVPYIGADICGFFDDSSEELCRRWMQVGAFYPFSRNHNAENYKPQDPASYGANSLLVATSKHYLRIRYTLLPYLYTLFYKAHTTGDTVVRPVMHEFYSDSQTWGIDRQFLWGKHLLITPVLDPGVDTVRTYIPDAVWYNYETMERLNARGTLVDLYLPADKLGLHIRGGAILPTQEADLTTTYSRRKPMGLIVALDDNKQAAGELFWDDGDSRATVDTGKYIHYEFSVISVRCFSLLYVLHSHLPPGLGSRTSMWSLAKRAGSAGVQNLSKSAIFSQGKLQMRVTKAGYTDPNNLKFENITILGVPYPPTSIAVSSTGRDGASTNMSTYTEYYDSEKKVLFLRDLSLTLGNNHLVTWELPSEDSQRFNCHPEDNADESKCVARGCIWKPSSLEKAPWCFYPEDYGYSVTTSQETSSGMTANIIRNKKYRSSGRPNSADIDLLRVQIYYHTSHMLQFKIWDPATDRYEVPVELSLPKTPETDESKRLYKVVITQNPFGIQVIRKSTGTKIWDSSVPGFTFSEMFLQVSTRLPSSFIYGFGETEHPTYKHDLNYHTWGMFTKDQPPGYKVNSYGMHPFYMGLETSANAHGVLLLNSNAMDVTLQPTPALTYRTIGGIMDFYMVLGPTPEMVVQEYTELIGRPVLPAYWTLGFQLCRYGYANDTEIEDLYNSMRAAGIPYDVQYADIDYMERQLNFVLDKDFSNLPALVKRIQNEGGRFIIILDPAISGNETVPYPAFDRGVEDDIFIKWPKEIGDEIVWGKVWPDYPNVTVNESLDWDTQIKLYRSYTAFPDFLRPATSNWWFREIKEFYENSMKFDGLWITGADICGFFNDAEYEMCLRWMHLGAFYPYSRNHNGKGSRRQDPVAWDEEFANYSRDVLNIRYTLLPYLYTLMFEAHTKGNTVIRPLLHEFVQDRNTWSIHKQFLWGPALLITAVLDKGVVSVDGYIPEARWYDYHTSKDIGVRGRILTMDTPINHINLHVRGGYILPWQKPENSTYFSRKNPLGLIVALSDDGNAEGSLFWDDGEGIDNIKEKLYLLTSFTAKSNELSSQVLVNGLATADRPILGMLKVWGAGRTAITSATLKWGSEERQLTPQHNPETQELTLDATPLSVSLTQPFTVTWRT